MKVWHMSVGRRACLFAGTKKAFAEAAGGSVYFINQYASETGNKDDLAIARANPGVLFVHSLQDRSTRTWRRATSPYDEGL